VIEIVTIRTRTKIGTEIKINTKTVTTITTTTTTMSKLQSARFLGDADQCGRSPGTPQTHCKEGHE
jgi:hypothetical protein